MKAIDLSGFAAKFAADEDPWRTFSNRDEAVKRAAILHALGPGPLGRVLELGSGNGSNSRAIAAPVPPAGSNSPARTENGGRKTKRWDNSSPAS